MLYHALNKNFRFSITTFVHFMRCLIFNNYQLEFFGCIYSPMSIVMVKICKEELEEDELSILELYSIVHC